jgi:hypothetical protein
MIPTTDPQEWYKLHREQYAHINDAQYNVIYSLAWDKGHAYGLSEVELYFSDFYDLCVDYVKAGK